MQNARAVRPHLIERTNKNDKQTKVKAQVVTSHSSYLICWLLITVHLNQAVVMNRKYTANESLSVLNVADTWIVHVYCILQSAK